MRTSPFKKNKCITSKKNEEHEGYKVIEEKNDKKKMKLSLLITPATETID